MTKPGHIATLSIPDHPFVARGTLRSLITRATDALLRRKNKKRLIIDLDSTEDPAPASRRGWL